MSNQSLPNTESYSVTISAIAWEIVNTCYRGMTFDSQEIKKIVMTNAFIEVYKAIKEGEPLKLDQE